MPNFEKAMNDSIIDFLTIAPTGCEESCIEGRIIQCDSENILIKITEGFEELTILNRNVWQFFDVRFHINQTPFQLQLQALDYFLQHNNMKYYGEIVGLRFGRPLQQHAQTNTCLQCNSARHLLRQASTDTCFQWSIDMNLGQIFKHCLHRE